MPEGENLKERDGAIFKPAGMKIVCWQGGHAHPKTVVRSLKCLSTTEDFNSLQMKFL
jgi:hypothetical protein